MKNDSNYGKSKLQAIYNAVINKEIAIKYLNKTIKNRKDTQNIPTINLT